MQTLAIANFIPMRDRSAGWFRFFHILRILASDHEVHLHAFDLAWQQKYYGKENICNYRDELNTLGVRTTNGRWDELSRFIQVTPVDVAFFEHYSSARGDIVDYVRFWHPGARVIVDTIDIAYIRLSSKAKLSRNQADLRLAEKVKAEELSAYARSDIVIGISHIEAALLEQADPALCVEVLPLIFATPPFQHKERDITRDLMFVGDFEHEANVDGIVHFCANVLPLIRKELPDVRLRVVGHSPPMEVTALSGPNVEVLGFVPDIGRIYRSSDVSIAPMRFGGGLKGKIAEAMSFGVPVVTNSACLEGFGLSPGMNVLVGDDPNAFAEAVVSLLCDRALYLKISENGWRFVKENFSEEVVAAKLKNLIERRHEYLPKKLTLGKRIAWNVRVLMERHLLWRFRGNGLDTR